MKTFEGFKKNQTYLVILSVFLLCMSFMTGSVASGPLSGNFITLALLMYMLWIDRHYRSTIAIRIIVSILASVGVLFLDSPSKLAVPAAVCFAAEYLNRDKEYNIYRALTLASVLTFIFFTMEQFCEPFRIFIDMTASAISGIGGFLIGRVISLGPTYAGTHLMIIFLILFVSLIILNFKRLSRLLKAVMLLMPFICNILYCAIWSLLSEVPIYDNFAVFEPMISPFDYRILLFVFLFITVMLINSRLNIAVESGSNNEHHKESQKHTIIHAACFIIFMSAAIILFCANFSNEKSPGRIAIYSSSESPVIFDKPEFNKYGLENVGMFGLLPEYLKSAGYTVDTIDKPDDAGLRDTKVLVIINLMKKLDQKYEESIWRFVQNGGSLLVLGDHTGTEEIRDPSNELLKPAGISFNFDCAIPLKDL